MNTIDLARKIFDELVSMNIQFLRGFNDGRLCCAETRVMEVKLQFTRGLQPLREFPEGP